MTETQLANRALNRIGQTRISNIDDPNSKAAITCKQFMREVSDEILGQHRWNCATRRATLSLIADVDDWGYKMTYQLPGDFIRIMELNGEQVEGSEEFFEIEGKRLKTDSDKAQIRYIAAISVSDFDAALAEVVACKLAAEIAIPLTANVALQNQALNMMERALGAARRVDAIQTGSRENRPLDRLMQNSPLLRSRGEYLPITRFFNKYPRW